MLATRSTDNENLRNLWDAYCERRSMVELGFTLTRVEIS